MKWLKRVVLGIVSLALLAVAVLYAWSGMIIGGKHTAVERDIALSTDPAVIARGERLSQVLGCFHGCHGANMEGDVFLEEAWIGRFVAPNLTTAFDRYSVEQLEALIRQGIRPDGTSLLGMPSNAFSIMTDGDLIAILSFIRTSERIENDPGKTSIGPLARLGLVMGEYQPAALETRQLWVEGFRDDPLKLGEYLAITACSECHGSELEGTEGFTPPLTIARAYSIEDFRTLMSTGLGLGERDLGLMSLMVQFRFKHMTDDEVAALHAYLQTL